MKANRLIPRVLSLVLIALLLSCAFAQGEPAPVLGGTKIWPEFRGMPFGLSSAAVIYREADAGLPIVCHKDGGAPIDISEAATARAYPVVTAETIDALGKGAFLRYEFQDGLFTQATLYWPMENDAEALEWLRAVSEHAVSVFGAPDELALRTADGEQLPADPQDDLYALFDDAVEHYGETTPFTLWDLGKPFAFSDGAAEQYEGSLNAYVKTVEPETLEAALGLEAGKPAVVLHIARLVSVHAAESYLSE
ncbi:MAG: hypothetical protein Q4A66_05800 [Eubacteriales bacterium]|nr:hypothetical protein [Eubacteriales bacterium]